MIYVCIPSFDEAPTVGLLLWKIRQVFAAFPREYQLLVLDDGSDDTTAEVLEPYARVLLLSIVTVPGVRDVVSGFAAFRLIALRNAIRSQADGLLQTDGWAANAELYWRAGRYARRIESVSAVERHDLRRRPPRAHPWDTVRSLWSARRTLRASPVPPPAPES